MKTIHKILPGLLAAITLALAPAANADDHHYHHGKYVYHHGYWGYYYGPRFYPYYAGPSPYYYGPYTGPGVTVAVAPRRHHFFVFF